MASAALLDPQRVHEEAQHLTNGAVKVNNWSQPGPAAFDFRSMSLQPPSNFLEPTTDPAMCLQAM